MYGLNTDIMWQQQRQAMQYQEDCREIQKAEIKAMRVENVRIQSMQVKSQLREQERERKKAIGDTLHIMANGELQIMTHNLSIPAIPRQVTDMRSPKLKVLIRQSDEAEQIFQINCFVGEKEKNIFLEKTQAGSGAYLLRKFASEGVYFMMETAKAKKFAVQLIAILQQGCNEEMLLPESEGWMKMPDGRFQYVGDEELTWEEAKKRCR